jgi:hypothetical protein
MIRGQGPWLAEGFAGPFGSLLEMADVEEEDSGTWSAFAAAAFLLPAE